MIIWVQEKEENMCTKERIGAFVENLKKEKLVQKYCLTSDTQVTPIMIWQDSVELNLITNKNYFNKFINRVVYTNKDILKTGYFVKSDGSTPSKIVFKFKG